MINNKPQISVIVPAFNEEKYLSACLDAIRKQTFHNYELIVVNNNSTDHTAEIAEKFGARVVLEKQQGMIPARERGFREAKAPIIARTDADSKPTPNWLKVILTTFNKYPEVVALTGPWLSPNKKIPDKYFKKWSYMVSVKLGEFFTGQVYILGPNMAIRKSAWEKISVNMDDKKVHEDIDLSCHLAKIGKIMYQPKMQIIASYRRVTENPVKGLMRYLGNYPIRYINTLYLNDPQFHKKVIKNIKERNF
jgi:glycosyltransferase involved in cell wall biosynthesis